MSENREEVIFLFQETEEQRVTREMRRILQEQLARSMFVPRRLLRRQGFAHD